MLVRLRRVGLIVGIGALGLLPLAAWLAAEPFYVGLFSRLMIVALAVLSLDLILGYGGMISFGHAAFLGVGAYIVGILAFHGVHSGWLQWPLAMLTAALMALIVGAISLATRGVYFIMITLAFGQMLYYAAQSLEKYGGDDGMTLWRRSEFSGLLDLANAYVFYYVVLGILLGCLFLSWRLVHSRFGMVLQGIRDNERRMQALGFPTYRYKLTGFAMAGGMAGLAGALLANQTEFVSPSFLHWSRSGEMLFMVTLGGMGTLFGPVLGATAFLLLEEIITSYTAHWKIIFGPVLVLFVLCGRRGVYGLLGGGKTADEHSC
jgi:branched-chain amino acid transport system permease protein